jgi:hypothetical protein
VRRGGDVTDRVHTTLSRDDRHGFRWCERPVQVWAIVTEFKNQQFVNVTLKGFYVDNPVERVEVTVSDVDMLPAWVIPWTVYLAWEVQE